MPNSVSTAYKVKTTLCALLPVFGMTFITQFLDFSGETTVKAKRDFSIAAAIVPNHCKVQIAHSKRYDRLVIGAQESNLKAIFGLANIYKNTNGADCQKLAFQWFLAAANAGETKAYAELGNAYKKGRGVEPDYDKAVLYLYKSAQHNYLGSAFALITMVEKGTAEHPSNPKQAKAYLDEFLPVIEKEIDVGNAVAARSLARLYYRSKIIKQDVERAISLYELASIAGDAIAKHDLALVLYKNRNTHIKQQRVLDLLHESAALGYAASYTALGRLHLKSALGLSRTEAVVWFKRGVEHGHGGAYQELAKLYLEGKIVAQDHAKALSFALEGTKLGHNGSRHLLNHMRKLGIASAQDKA